MILVFGQSGQVAQALARQEADVVCLPRTLADLTKPGSCEAAIASYAPRAVINAAAYTAVDRAEREEALALRVNGDAPGEMARICAMRDIPLVHLSTDYVFDGKGDEPFRPGDATAPLNAYGRTKLAGEREVVAAACIHAIVRTSWVFGPGGDNFVSKMLRLSSTMPTVRVVADQIGGPTPAEAIAQACLAIAGQLIADPAKSGTYHFSGAPDVSWADFSRAIFEAAGRDTRVENIATSQFPTPARRPANGRLDCSSLTTFGLQRPDWKAALTPFLSALESQ